MSDFCCKKCNSTDYVKSGFVRGHQRYLCHSCGCNFTNTPRRGKPEAMKSLAILLYAMGNMSFCSIARRLACQRCQHFKMGSGRSVDSSRARSVERGCRSQP